MTGTEWTNKEQRLTRRICGARIEIRLVSVKDSEGICPGHESNLSSCSALQALGITLFIRFKRLSVRERIQNAPGMHPHIAKSIIYLHFNCILSVNAYGCISYKG